MFNPRNHVSTCNILAPSHILTPPMILPLPLFFFSLSKNVLHIFDHMPQWTILALKFNPHHILKINHQIIHTHLILAQIFFWNNPFLKDGFCFWNYIWSCFWYWIDHGSCLLWEYSCQTPLWFGLFLSLTLFLMQF